jgi:glycosyltransferase involved in cell wall biosynthesis
MKILAVIPVYNSWEHVSSLVSAVILQGVDVCIVDDGSAERNSSPSLSRQAVILRHPDNLGKGAALRTGFGYALEKGYDGVITLDSDGQHDPEEIPLFLDAAGTHHFVIGKRDFCHPSMPLMRRLSNGITSFLLTRLLNCPVEDAQCGYRYIHKEVLAGVSTEKAGFEMESEMIIKAARKGFIPYFIPVRTIYSGEKSAIRGFRDTAAFVRLYFKALFRSL